MHPLVRDLYKRAILVGRDYPHQEGIDYVRRTWKEALRNTPEITNNEPELRKAIGKGRYMIREMEGVIQLKKYRAMKKRYGGNSGNKTNDNVKKAVEELEARHEALK